MATNGAAKSTHSSCESPIVSEISVLSMKAKAITRGKISSLKSPIPQGTRVIDGKILANGTKLCVSLMGIRYSGNQKQSPLLSRISRTTPSPSQKRRFLKMSGIGPDFPGVRKEEMKSARGYARCSLSAHCLWRMSARQA